MKPEKILFLGNSITFHPADVENGFLNACGMAASSEEFDYVHLLLNKFTEAAGGKTPASIIQNIADFERQHMDMDMDAFFKQHIEFKADMLILAIGENVPALETEESKLAYKNGMNALLAIIKASGCSQIVVRSCFWPDETKDIIMQKACEDAGGIWIDIGYLSKDETSYARSEREYKHDGIAGHPGDRGMQGIADAIWGAISN